MAASRPTISVVVPSHNEGTSLAPTVRSLLASLPRAREIIVVDDHSSDGSAAALAGHYQDVMVRRPSTHLGVASARNFGAEQARGDIILFSDAHVEVVTNSIVPLLEMVRRPEVGAVAPAISFMHRPFVKRPRSKGYGGRWGKWRDSAELAWTWGGRNGPDPFPMPLLSGCFVAMRREIFQDMGGFDPGMTGWGHEDAELCLRLWTSGYQCLVIPTLEVAHELRPVRPYRVNRQLVLHNLLRMAIIHFSHDRLTRLLAQQTISNPLFSAALTQVIVSDALTRRSNIRANRNFDDSWFFHRFGMD